jgi:microcystin-dependent protein
MLDPFIGQIQAFGFNFAPQNWAFCDGSLLPIAENEALFALIGTTFGGDGQTTFALPDLRGRSIVHPGNGPGLSPISQGQSGGVENVTLTPNNLPSHNHPVSVVVNTATGEESASTSYLASHASAFSDAPAMGAVLNGVTSGPAGGGQAFSNRDPYLGTNYCIALYGIFPPRN